MPFTFIASHLIPLVDQFTHFLIETGKNKLHQPGMKRVQSRKSRF
jgi:hypothetical protein